MEYFFLAPHWELFCHFVCLDSIDPFYCNYFYSFSFFFSLFVILRGENYIT